MSRTVKTKNMISLHVKRKMLIIHDREQTKRSEAAALRFQFESKSQRHGAILSKLKFPWYMYSNTHLQ